jgi:hypothetical protein
MITAIRVIPEIITKIVLNVKILIGRTIIESKANIAKVKNR